MSAASGSKRTQAAVDRPLRFFEVEIRLNDAGGQFDDTHGSPFAKWEGLATNANAARAQAMEDCWDDRLNSATSPAFATSESDHERYLVADEWLHAFAADPSLFEPVRWVYDRGTKQVLAAQIACEASPGWEALDAERLSELQRDLFPTPHGSSKTTGQYDTSCVDRSSERPDWVASSLESSVSAERPRRG